METSQELWLWATQEAPAGDPALWYHPPLTGGTATNRRCSYWGLTTFLSGPARTLAVVRRQSIKALRGVKITRRGDPVLGPRVAAHGLPLSGPHTAAGRHSPTSTLAARQVHQLQPGVHLLCVPGGAARRGPREPTRAREECAASSAL